MRSVFYPHLVNGPFGDPALYVRIAHQGEALLFDCGDLHPLTPRELLKIRAVFISHAHIDHLVGFDPLLRQFLYRETPLNLYGPPGLIDQIGARLAGYTWNLIHSYPLKLTVREWGEETGRETTFRAHNAFRAEEVHAVPCPSGQLFTTPGFRVCAYPLDHGDIVSLAFVLEETRHVAIHKDALLSHGYRPGPWLTSFKERLRGQDSEEVLVQVPLEDGSATGIPLTELATQIAHVEEGMKLCYVTDVSPTERNLVRIRELAADAHLLAIEATFTHDDLERARQRNHLTAQLAGDLARQARAARLLVFHHSPRYQYQPELLATEAAAAFLGTSEKKDQGRE